METEIIELKQQLKSYHDENTFLMDQNIQLKQNLEKCNAWRETWKAVAGKLHESLKEIYKENNNYE